MEVVSGYVGRNKGAVAVYGGVSILLLTVIHFLSDRDFSFLMVSERARRAAVARRTPPFCHARTHTRAGHCRA